jgi:hypothetical protein
VTAALQRLEAVSVVLVPTESVSNFLLSI